MSRRFVPLIGIVPEGWFVILLLALIVGVAYYNARELLAASALLLILPVGVYFHDSPRRVPSRPRGILCPVDGTVVFRRECHDPVIEREAVSIRIRVDRWGGYCLRAPIEGEVVPAPRSYARAVSCLRTDEGDQVIVALTRGAMLGARPIWLPFGERVGQGRRCGVRRFAREIEMLVPAGVRVEVALGERVRCGETVIATLLRRKA